MYGEIDFIFFTYTLHFIQDLYSGINGINVESQKPYWFTFLINWSCLTFFVIGKKNFFFNLHNVILHVLSASEECNLHFMTSKNFFTMTFKSSMFQSTCNYSIE